eukprot:gene11337-12653_t
MPHSTTKKFRPSRPDTRPSAKHRTKVVRAAQDKVKIQDMRVTRIASSEKKEREPQPTAMSNLSKDEKRLRGLKKKLKDINELIEKQSAGQELDKQQLVKIKQLDEVLEAIESIVSIEEVKDQE